VVINQGVEEEETLRVKITTKREISMIDMLSIVIRVVEEVEEEVDLMTTTTIETATVRATIIILQINSTIIMTKEL
jgi:hypothetical protein